MRFVGMTFHERDEHRRAGERDVGVDRGNDGIESIVVGPVFLALVEAILDYFDEKVIAPNKPELDAKSWGLIR